MASEVRPPIEIRDLQYEVPDRLLFAGVNLPVDPGEVVAVLGPSGAGKTSLLHLVAGILVPTAGTISIAGFDMGRRSDDQRAVFRLAHIGMLFQFAELLPELNVRENVALPLLLLGEDRDVAAARADAWLERVRLGDFGDAMPAVISGGEAQRVGLARALVHEPEVILADEPTGSLDEDTGKHVANLMIELARQSSAALVVVTHNPMVSALADRVAVLTGGGLHISEPAG